MHCISSTLCRNILSLFDPLREKSNRVHAYRYPFRKIFACQSERWRDSDTRIRIRASIYRHKSALPTSMKLNKSKKIKFAHPSIDPKSSSMGSFSDRNFRLVHGKICQLTRGIYIGRMIYRSLSALRQKP